MQMAIDQTEPQGPSYRCNKNEAPRSDAASAVRTVHWTTRVSNDLSDAVHGLTSASDEGEGESEEDTLAWH